jgi:hypothetical protein
MTIKFPERGLHDNKPTPKTLYDIITQELKFTDVCLDKNRFNAAVKLWPDHSYCNPPFSNKKPFILRAIASNRILHSEILLYLPFDTTTSWFHLLYQQNVLIMVFMKRMMHAKFPHALYHLKTHTHTQVVLLHEERDVLKYIK